MFVIKLPWALEGIINSGGVNIRKLQLILEMFWSCHKNKKSRGDKLVSATTIGFDLSLEEGMCLGEALW